MKNILYFDLETQKSAEEVGGWDKISDMRMSVGVLYSTATGSYRIYPEREVDQLIKDLQRADLIVGFNHLRFDFEVLHGYTALDLRQLPTLDLLLAPNVLMLDSGCLWGGALTAIRLPDRRVYQVPSRSKVTPAPTE